MYSWSFAIMKYYRRQWFVKHLIKWFMSCTSSWFNRKTTWYSVDIILFVAIWCWSEGAICKLNHCWIYNNMGILKSRETRHDGYGWEIQYVSNDCCLLVILSRNCFRISLWGYLVVVWQVYDLSLQANIHFSHEAKIWKLWGFLT